MSKIYKLVWNWTQRHVSTKIIFKYLQVRYSWSVLKQFQILTCSKELWFALFGWLSVGMTVVSVSVLSHSAEDGDWRPASDILGQFYQHLYKQLLCAQMLCCSTSISPIILHPTIKVHSSRSFTQFLTTASCPKKDFYTPPPCLETGLKPDLLSCIPTIYTIQQ